ncbi:MAG: hypothetical protein ACRCV6_10430 [Formosimonas sp.]
MTQQIDPVKLKAAAEHLEWACQQYPNDEKVQGLYRGLLSMIEDAKAGRVLESVEEFTPFSWVVSAEGLYDDYKNPSIGSAYVDFATEMEGGLTEQDKRIIANMELQRKAILEGDSPKEVTKSSANNLNLTEEQQAIFDRVVNIVTQNSELRQRFKAANDELDKNPEGNELEYIVESDEADAVEFRAVADEVQVEIGRNAPDLKANDPWLFSDIRAAICKDFREN